MSIRLNPQPGLTAALIDGKLDISLSKTLEPDNQGGGQAYVNRNYNIEPLQNSPNETWNIHNINVNIDNASTGFDIGTSGTAIQAYNFSMSHQGISDIGSTAIVSSYINIGNGTNAIDYKGHSIFYGFGEINDNVTLTGPLQGYGFQLTLDANVTMNASSYVTAFYDFATINGSSRSYTSFSAGPTVDEILNNYNMTSVNLNPTINNFVGNAGYNGIGIAGNFGTFDTGTFNGIIINPNVGSVNNAYGIFADMQNVTATNKWAGYFNGDVQINGALSFTGALSMGQVSAYASLSPVVNGGGNPTTIHGLITQMVAPASATIANVDTIGVNTAALITINSGATLTSGAIGLGLTALGLPAVVQTHTGSSVDFIAGAVFAINMDGSSTGGTIDTLIGGRFTAIPNGITTVNNFYGAYVHMPFGAVATNNFGIYSVDFENNYFEGAIKIGDTESLTNSSVGLEIESTTKAFLNARMTTTERNALTAVNGMQIYNSTTDKLQVYAAGSWVDLH